MIRSIMLIVAVLAVVTVGILQGQLVIPVNTTARPCLTTLKMEMMGYPAQYAPSISLAAHQTMLSPELLMALIQTESGFDILSVSSKGYKGLMQIPHNVFDPDVNILIGAKILREKLTLANGNLEQAIILYKGYKHDQSRGKIQARKAINLYRLLQKMEV